MPKLSNLRSFVVKTEPPHKGGLLWYFLKLETDDGHEGWGETAILAALYGLEDGYEELVRNIFDTHLKGQDALDRERLYQKLYSALSMRTSDYVMHGIIAAFDTALWDICGKHYKTPVYNLLGGKVRDKIRAYTYIYDRDEDASLLATGRLWIEDHERLAEMAARFVDDGFTGLKFDPIRQRRDGEFRPWDLPQSELAQAERGVGAVREAVGERADIMIGTHGQTTPAAAIRLAKRLEQFDPLWLEEPCPPENFKEMGKVARATSIPIATGERLVTASDFQALFAEGACAVAQPDLGSAGGITGTKKIATIAEASYVLMAPHVWGGPVITAAAVQIDATVPNFLIQESIDSAGGFFDEIIKEPFVWEDGDFVVTDRPGIGIELDENKLEKYRGKLSDFNL
jgi:2-dehydro-3-deoxyphosphogalactonate aldolase